MMDECMDKEIYIHVDECWYTDTHSTHPLIESKAISIILTLSVWNNSMESLWLDVILEVGTLTISLKDYETREIRITFRIITCTCTCMCNLTVFMLNKHSFISNGEKHIPMIALLFMITMVSLFYHSWLSHAWN